jgi:hypothetical protein
MGLVESEAELSIRRQCKLLALNRSTAYYEAAPTPAEDSALMRIIDEVYTARPILSFAKTGQAPRRAVGVGHAERQAADHQRSR